MQPPPHSARAKRPPFRKSPPTIPSPTLALPTFTPLLGDDTIVIHIIDEALRVNKDFDCSKSLLLRHMKYFKTYITESESAPSPSEENKGDIDISVHCSLPIFTFLYTHMHSPLLPPPLSATTVIPILVSSDFLIMNDLVDCCLVFIACHLNENLINLGDLECLSDVLIHKLAKLCNAEVLIDAVGVSRDYVVVDERKNKVLERLFKKRVEIDFRERGGGSSSLSSTSLMCCRDCCRLYLEDKSLSPIIICENLTNLPLPDSNSYSDTTHKNNRTSVVSFNGTLLPPTCTPARHFTITKYVASLRAQHTSWRDIYWILWSSSNMLVLKNSEGVVRADCEFHGRCHAEEAVYEKGMVVGKYRCCGASARRFNPWEDPRETGCARCTVLSLLAPIVKSYDNIDVGKLLCYNREVTVRVANKAKRVLGEGYAKKFEKETRAAMTVHDDNGNSGSGNIPSPSPNTPTASIAKVMSNFNSNRPSSVHGSRRALMKEQTDQFSSSSSNPSAAMTSNGSIDPNTNYDSPDALCTVVGNNKSCDSNEKNCEAIRKYRVFIATPSLHNSPAAFSEISNNYSAFNAGYDGSRGIESVLNSAVPRSAINSMNIDYTGPLGFIKYAASIGVHIDSQRYLKSFGWLPPPSGGVESLGFCELNGFNSAVIRSLHEPLKGLHPIHRAGFTRTSESKVALTLDKSKREGWYREMQCESDVERMRQIGGKLGMLRVYHAADVREEEEGGGRKNQKNLMRGGTWRSNFEIKWVT